MCCGSTQAVWILGNSCSLKKGVAGLGKEEYVLFNWCLLFCYWSPILSLLSYSSE